MKSYKPKNQGDKMFNEIENEETRRKVIETVSTYKGDARVLGNALGAMSLGHMYGRRVAMMVYSKKTLRKYQGILGVDFSEIMPEETSLSDRSIGYTTAKTLKSFWRVQTGDIECPNRHDLTGDFDDQMELI